MPSDGDATSNRCSCTYALALATAKQEEPENIYYCRKRLPHVLRPKYYYYYNYYYYYYYCLIKHIISGYQPTRVFVSMLL